MRTIALTGLAFIVLASSQAAVTKTSVDSAGATASSLVELFLNEPSIIERVRRDIPVALQASPAFQTLEARYPGITDFVSAKLLPGMEKRAAESVPRMNRQLSAYLSSQLSGSDLAAALAFYRSPIGTKAINIMRSMSAASAMPKIATVAGRATGGDVESMMSASVAANGGFARKFTVAELNEYLRFLNSEPGKRWSAAQTGFFVTVAKILNEGAQENNPKVQAEAIAAVTEYRLSHEQVIP